MEKMPFDCRSVLMFGDFYQLLPVGEQALQSTRDLRHSDLASWHYCHPYSSDEASLGDLLFDNAFDFERFNKKSSLADQWEAYLLL